MKSVKAYTRKKANKNFTKYYREIQQNAFYKKLLKVRRYLKQDIDGVELLQIWIREEV